MQIGTNTKVLASTALAIAGGILFSRSTPVSAHTATITTSNSITLDVTPTGNGTSIHEESINVTTTCRAGYNLSIATPEGSNLYQYTNGTASNTASFTAVNGSSALNSANNTNKWGYTLTANATDSTVFSPLSASSTPLKTTSQTASPSSDIDDTFSIYYGIKTDSTIAPGSYQMANHGAIVYYLTMDTSCTQYTVSFNANGGTGTIANQDIQENVATKLTSADGLTPPTTTDYTDAGNNPINGTVGKLWTFWGWNTAIDGTGNWYKDREAVTNLENAGNTITLYAQWKQATLTDLTPGTPIGTEKVIDHDEMQDIRPEVCWNSTAYSTDTSSNAHTPYNASTNPNGYHTITLLDYRGKVTTGSSPESPEQYTVSKLADGLCWMTKNLNLGRSTGGANNNGTITLTSDDTDLADDTTFTLPSADTTSYTSATRLAKVRLTNNENTNNNGAYYTWSAAVANTSSISTSPTTSICPRSWDLPTDTMYTNLSSKSVYTSSNPTSAQPGNFLIDGGFTNGASFYQTSYSHFWTNRSSTTTAAYGARVNDTAITVDSSTGTTYGGNKYYRKNIRCVANMGTAIINYNANNGSASTSIQNVDINNSSLAASNLFPAENNQQFKEWNTKADGTGTGYAAGTSTISLNLYPGQSIELYAIWNDVYYIAFNNNNGSGTMSNQIVIRGTTTAIKTNTFTRSGYIFRGWNTSSDGNGIFYTDGQQVTNLTSTGNTITLYAIWVDGAYLATGQNVNQKLKRLAGNSSAYYDTSDTAITAILRSNTLPSGFTESTNNTISDSSSPHKIYAWYDSTNTTIYYYSEANEILMNKTSSNTFYRMYALSDLSTISAWDTAKVTNMSSMFSSAGENAATWSVGDLSSWNTSSVTDMSSMFSDTGKNAATWSVGDLSSWNTSSVTNMSSMFSHAGLNATTWSAGDLSSWNTSSVTNMNKMFYYAARDATTFILDLSSWDTSNVTDISRMFYYNGFNSTTFNLNLSSWDISKVANMDEIFLYTGHNSTSFVLNVSSWNTSGATSMKLMFFGAGQYATTWSIGDLSSWNTSNVTNMSTMFCATGQNATTWSVGDLSSWNTSNVTDMSSMFSNAGQNATTWSVGDLSSWNTSKVTDMSSMFSNTGKNATAWSVGDLSSWNTSSVTDMSNMLYSVGYSVNVFNISYVSSWDTSSVTDMTGMFYQTGYNSTTLTLDLSSWNTSSVTDMDYMFYQTGYNSTTLTLDLSSWNTSSVTNMNSMFYYAGQNANTWSITIPKTNDGTATGSISNTTSNLYGSTTSVTAPPPSGRSFTLAN